MNCKGFEIHKNKEIIENHDLVKKYQYMYMVKLSLLLKLQICSNHVPLPTSVPAFESHLFLLLLIMRYCYASMSFHISSS